jgi:uncharacterized membrane protein
VLASAHDISCKGKRMNRIPRPARIAYALGIIGLGMLGVVYGDFASAWPAWVPWRQALLSGAAAVMVLGGAGLLFARTAPISVRLLLPYLLLWMALRIPALIVAPQIEVNWFAVGETAVLAAGAWALFADFSTARDGSIFRFATGARGRRIARMLFGLALPAFGLSHFIYVGQTAPLVPSWLPFPNGWAYLTGAGHIAAGLGVLFSVYPRLAASLEAAMLTIFTVLVWIPRISAATATRDDWSEFVISWAIAAGAWVVAGSIAAGRADSPSAQID